MKKKNKSDETNAFFLRSNIFPNRIDLVPNGSNQESFIEMAKSEPNSKEVEPMTFEEVMKGLTDDQKQIVMNEFQKGIKDATDSMAQQLKEAVDKVEKATANIEEMRKAMPEPTDEEKFEEMKKSLPKEMQDHLAHLEEQLEAKKVEEANTELALISEMAKGLDSLSLDNDAFAKHMQIIKNANEATYEEMVRLFKSANTMIKEGIDLDSKGQDIDGEHDGDGDSYEKLSSMAKALAEKEGISFAEALTTVVNENKELYEA